MLLLFGMIREQQREAVAATLERAAQGISNAVGNRLTDEMAHLAGLAQSTALDRGDIESFRTEAQRLLDLRTDWITVVLTDSERPLVNLRFPQGEALPPLRDPESLRRVWTTRSPAIGNFIDRTVGVRFPVIRNGTMRHTVVAALSTTVISDLLQAYGLPAQWVGAVVDGNGIILARNTAAERFVGTLATADVRAQFGPTPSGVFQATVKEGGPVYAFSMPIPETPWHVAIAAPVAVVEAEYRAIMWLLVSGAAVAIAAAGALSMSLARRGTRVAERRMEEFKGERDRADQENREKSAFLALMSHELRTPLNGILGFAQVLAQSGLTQEQASHVEHQKQAAHTLLRLIDGVLDYSKIEAGCLELESISFDLPDLVGECVALIRPMAKEKGLEIRLMPEPDLPRFILGDPLRLRQILVNLLGNAVKFTTHGAVSVSVGHRRRDDGSLDLSFIVRDTGPGIPAERMDRLFHRFSQVDASTTRQFGGTGLGLAICKALVDLMGGAIRVESVVGKGSAFHFTIHAALGDKPSDDETPPAPQPPRAARQGAILLVEDSQLNQIVARAMLQKAGHHVDVAENGAEAVAAVQERPFDLVLMDVMMPVLDGIEATRTIRSLPGPVSALPIIALTASTDPQDIEACHAAGMNGCLGKPIVWQELLDTIADHIEAGNAPAAMENAAHTAPFLAEEMEFALSEAIKPALLIPLLEMFVEQADGWVEELERHRTDPHELRAVAHRLSGTSGYFGFTALWEACRALECACREGRTEHVQHGLETVESELHKAKTAAFTKATALAGELDPAKSRD
ncbi:ATP-binding protein [Azospirillum sp. sgz301742]